MEDETLDNLLVDEQTSPTNETPEVTDEENEDNSQQEDPKAKRHAQQLEGSRKQAERMEQLAIEMASENATVESISKLYAKDPKLAEKVAKHLSFDSYSDLMKKHAPEQEKQYFTKEEFEKALEEREIQKEHEKSAKKADRLLSKLPEELIDQAKEYFDEITEGKKLDEDKAIKYAEMATLYVQKDKLREERGVKALDALASTGLTNSKKPQKSEPRYERAGNGEVILITD